jgi:hypothetical protein
MYIEISTGQNGYSAEQVSDQAITLEAFIQELQDLLDEGIGPQTRVVMRAYGRGAVYEPVTKAELAVGEDEDEDPYV